MRLLVSFCSLAVCLAAASRTYRTGDGIDPRPWREIFGAFGLTESDSPDIAVVQGDGPSKAPLTIRIGGSAAQSASVRRIIDAARPALEIVWEQPQNVPLIALPRNARVLARDRWSSAPVMASWPKTLWIATPPGEHGYERYPYLMQALATLGFEPPFASRQLWAFFDSGYRSRADLDYLAERWRAGGISALHVAAWHYYESDPERDAYLKRLIDACHRRLIHVYAWIELPHVSERFWQEHPEWREKTALGEDAHLDWRKLMNLRNPDCQRAVRSGIDAMVTRFDWDGVNLAELYFESLEGAANPARFTPMNDDVRREVRETLGFDPKDILGKPNDPRLRKFLDYRAGLALRLQKSWLEILENHRRARPHLDLVWTHIDDRFDPRMRDLLGADSAQALKLAAPARATFLIEDPATVWNLGPRRYLEIAKKYGAPPAGAQLAIDINIVERYQDVYPTKQQTGVELFQLAHHAAQVFPRVALYFENSILPPDYPLLAAASAAKPRFEGGTISAPAMVGVRWDGAVLANGKPWPISDGLLAWLPPGRFELAPAAKQPDFRILDLNAELLDAGYHADGIELRYRSSACAFVLANEIPGAVELDGKTWPVEGPLLRLPAGEHRVSLKRPASVSRNPASAARN